jgi:hypothetical protein
MPGLTGGDWKRAAQRNRASPRPSHLVIWLALPLVMAVACTLLVAVAPS